jgi:hypothetical protein
MSFHSVANLVVQSICAPIGNAGTMPNVFSRHAQFLKQIKDNANIFPLFPYYTAAVCTYLTCGSHGKCKRNMCAQCACTQFLKKMEKMLFNLTRVIFHRKIRLYVAYVRMTKYPKKIIFSFLCRLHIILSFHENLHE